MPDRAAIERMLEGDRKLIAETRRMLDPNSADWKDGYLTGMAEGRSGHFAADGSYIIERIHAMRKRVGKRASVHRAYNRALDDVLALLTEGAPDE